MRFHGLNYYTHQPDALFDFYCRLGLRVVQQKEADSYYGAALALGEGQEPLLWIWATPQGEEQPCCNHLYFKSDDVPGEYARLQAAGIQCPAVIDTFWGGKELIVSDPDGNTVLFVG